MTAWQMTYIGIDGDDAEINDLKVWKHKWRSLHLPPVKLPHPQYPNQIHDYWIYEIGDPAHPMRFAAGELSACVWGFYVPGKSN